MAQYVDSFVIPIKKKNLAKYKKFAQLGCRLWMKHGALSYYECIGDDFLEYGLGFRKMCKLKSDETVVVAFIVFKSKAHRNTVNKKVIAEMNGMFEEPDGMKMPFDMKRFSTAGCKTMVHSK